MAIEHLSYCNSSLGKQITFDFDNSSKAISNVVVGSACSSPQPEVIAYDMGPFGLALQGYIYPINVHPYAQHVPYGNSGGCTLAITPVVTNATNNQTANGSIQINATGKNLYTSYSIDGGATFQADSAIANAHIFSNLLPGTYSVVVVTNGLFGSDGSCTVFAQVVVGYNDIVCDLQLGSIVTESASGASGKIKVLTLLGFQAPVEYRLDAGAWQDSAEFTGLVAGTYNVQVRYKTVPSCIDSRNVEVAESNSCDLVINDVQIIHEQTKYGDDGALKIVAASSNTPIQYSIDGGSTWQSTDSFANLSPGVYQIEVIDDGGCSASRTVEVLRYKRPIVVFPIVNSNRFVITAGPMVPIVKRQNFDNTLFADMHFAGVDECCYSQRFELNDSIVNQFRSNYKEHVVKVYNEAGEMLSNIPAYKKTSYLDKAESLTALFADAGSNKTQVFFENGLPSFFEVGQDITITDAPTLNGTYEIVDITQGIGAAVGYQVLVIEKLYTSASAVEGGTVDVIYDVEPYEVYEFTTLWSVFGAGKYYITVEGTDPQFLNFVATSEPVHAKAVWDDHVQMKYRCFDNAKLVLYDTGITHLIRVKGTLKFPQNPGDRKVYTDSRDKLIKLESYVRRTPELWVYELPYYMLERIAQALDCDLTEVDDVEYQTEDDFTMEYFDGDALGNGKGKLRQVDYPGENGDDAGDDIDVLGTNDTLLGVS